MISSGDGSWSLSSFSASLPRWVKSRAFILLPEVYISPIPVAFLLHGLATRLAHSSRALPQLQNITNTVLILSLSPGVYYQAFMLASPKWRRIASWITGWLFIVGNITITLAVNFGSTLFFVSCINVFEKEPGVGIFAGETWQVFLIFLALTLFCNAVSAFGNKWLPWLDVSVTRPSFLPAFSSFYSWLKGWRYCLALHHPSPFYEFVETTSC